MMDPKMSVLEEGSTILHPVRWKIVEVMEAEGRPMYVTEIAEKVGIERRLVSFHLTTLENRGFTTSSFEVIQKANSLGKAGRYYTLTSKVIEIKKKIVELVTSD